MGKKATFSVRPFEKLRKSLEQQTAAAAPPPPRRKKKEDYTDEELFSKEMDGVEEIAEFRSLACIHRRNKEHGPEAPRRDPDHETLMILGELAAGLGPINLPDTQEYVEWVNPGHLDTIIPRLHEGRFSVQAFLDLHGCTVPEADAELDRFLQESFKKGLRCVKIIHGRGLRSVKGPRIKDSVIKRLAGHYRKDIIAFVTARQCDGGLGALYVLIKKK